MADVVAKKNLITRSFSVAGSSKWSQGRDTSTEILDRGKGSIRFGAYEIWGDAISNITSQKHGNVYCDSYAQAFQEAIDSSEDLGEYLDAVGNKKLDGKLDGYKTDTHLQQQLHQVARIIRTALASSSSNPRSEEDAADPKLVRRAERDFFFVQLGGFDHHSGLQSGLAEKLREVDEAIAGFVEELEKQKIFESVVLVTESDFGRTLSFNGQGTDHGWGGNHIIVGGGIQGGQVFNEFLQTYQLDSEMDAGRGRVIPKYPWESMMVPIAKWVGVDDPDTIFPNLKNFNNSKGGHITQCSDLFDQDTSPCPSAANA